MSNFTAPPWRAAGRLAALLLALLCCTGCASTVIGTATDTVIAVAKVPLKVGGAIVDVATDGD